MTPRKIVMAACMSALMACSAAQASGYIALDGASVGVGNQLDDDLNPKGVRLRLGMRVAPMFDLEAHVGSAMDNSASVFDKFGTTFAGAYLKGYLPVGRQSALFALAGISAVEHTQTLDNRKFTDSLSGFSYGFGLETQLTHNLDLSADYMRYANDGDEPYSEVSAVSLGLKLYF